MTTFQIDFEGDDDNLNSNSRPHVTADVDLGYGDTWNSFMIETDGYAQSNPGIEGIRDSNGNRTPISVRIDGTVSAYNTGEGLKGSYFSPPGTYESENVVSLLGDHIAFNRGKGTTETIDVVFEGLEAGVYELISYVEFTDHPLGRPFKVTSGDQSVIVDGQQLQPNSGENVVASKNAGTISGIEVDADGRLVAHYTAIEDDPSIAGLRLTRIGDLAEPEPEPDIKPEPEPEPETGPELKPEPETKPDPEPTPGDGSASYTLPAVEISGAGDVVTLSANECWFSEATVAFGFNADTTSGTRGLFSRDASQFAGDGNHISAYIDDGVLIARFQDGEDEVFFRKGGISAGEDYHVALTFGDDTVEMYLDGSLVGRETLDMDWETSPEHIQFGALGWSSASGSASFKDVFDGRISDVAIYEMAMDDAAIADLAVESAPESEMDTPAYSASEAVDISRADDVVILSGDQFHFAEATVAFGFNADTTSGTRGLFSRDASQFAGDGNHISAYIDDGVLIARFQDGEDEVFFRKGGISAGEDYHVALTFGDDTVEMYLDGSLVGRETLDMDWETSPEHIQFGALGWSSASGSASFKDVFDGRISDVAIYDTELSEQMVANFADDFVL